MRCFRGGFPLRSRFFAQKINVGSAVFSVQNGGLQMSLPHLNRHFASVWLADQCRCPQCFHQQTLQRLRSDSVSVNHSSVSDIELSECKKSLLVKFAQNEHSTLHPISHLMFAGSGATTQLNKFRLSNAPDSVTSALTSETVDISDVMKSEDGVRRVLEAIDENGFAFVSGLEHTEQCTKDVLNRIGFMQNTIFGDFWSFTVDTESSAERLQHADTAYTGLAIEPHTDGSYALEPPGLQSFHVLSFKGLEGTSLVESVLVDGFKVARDFASKFPKEFAFLCNTDLDWKYFDPNKSHLHCMAPVIVLEKSDPDKIKQIRWNHYDRGDLRHLLVSDQDLLLKAFDAIAKWRSFLLESPHKIVYNLIPGKLVIFDNWRMLHGRNQFVGRRSLCGCYHDRQLFISRLSVLREEEPDMFT